MPGKGPFDSHEKGIPLAAVLADQVIENNSLIEAPIDFLLGEQLFNFAGGKKCQAGRRRKNSGRIPNGSRAA